MLTLKEVSLRKGKRTYLDEVSFTAEAGRITAIVGTRSAGRTELVRIIMGLIAADEGTIELEDFELAFGDRQNFGYLPAERGGYPNMRVLDQIVYLARLHGITLGAAERNALTLLGHLELADRGYAPLKNLSGAEIARVDIAATLAADPDVLIVLHQPDGDGSDVAEEMISQDQLASLRAVQDQALLPLLFNFAEPASPLVVDGLERIHEWLVELEG